VIPTVDAARLALAPYLLWVKLAVVLLMLALIFGAGWKAGASLTEGRWQRAAAKQAADYQSSVARAREAERASYAKSQEVSRGYQQKLAALDADYRAALGRIGPVRVRNCPTVAGGLPATGAAASRPTGANDRADIPATAGSDPSRDIGPDLVTLARDADHCREQLTALQEWAAKSAHP
jgi:hypothetical protein